MNLIRNNLRAYRYRRQLAEIAYHQRRCEVLYIEIHSTEISGRSKSHANRTELLAQLSAMRAHHRYMIEQLKAQIYGGAK